MDTLLCPKCIVFDICSVQEKWLVPSCPLFRGFTALDGIILDVKYWGALSPNLNIRGAGAPPPSPPSSYAPAFLASSHKDGIIYMLQLLSRLPENICLRLYQKLSQCTKCHKISGGASPRPPNHAPQFFLDSW